MKNNQLKRAIPNLLTMGNLMSGFLAINFTINGDLRSASILIFIAIMLDAMDGRVARILGVSGEFGKQLDSLADIVSFGVAPAFMASYIYYDGSTWGVILSGLFPLFGAYRLARFNLMPSDSSLRYFKGIPITLAGGIVAFLTLFETFIPNEIFTAVFILLGLLMVSKVKIPSMKKMELPKNAIVTAVFLFYTAWVVFGIKPEAIPGSFYVALIVYIAFITIRMIKVKEPKVKFKKFKKIGPLTMKGRKRKK